MSDRLVLLLSLAAIVAVAVALDVALSRLLAPMSLGWVQVTPCAGSLCLEWALPAGAHAAIVKSRRSPSGPWTQHLPASPTTYTLLAPAVPIDVQVVFVPTGDCLFATATPLWALPSRCPQFDLEGPSR